jgi:deoxycytidylate deaminase
MVPMHEAVPDRIPLEEVYMRMAEELAKRSTCARSQVGSVITTGDLTQVLGIGYNGNARGLPNACDGVEPGKCGCFVAGSPVRTPSGDVEIQRLRVGDWVLTHRNRYRQVTELFRHRHRGELVELFLENGSTANLGRRKTATPEHPFLVRREAGEVGWVAAGEIAAGDEIAIHNHDLSQVWRERVAARNTPDVRAQHDGIIWINEQPDAWSLHEGAFAWSAISARRTRPIDQPVFNLEVEEDHSYVCQAAVVHNCIHSEANALIKAGAHVQGKTMFVTMSPCVMCAKMIINSNVRRVYFRTEYREALGVEVLRQGGVEACLYDRWRDLWRP